MRFYRGIAVPKAKAPEIIENIRQNGISSNVWSRPWCHYPRPDPSLINKVDLSREDTRPEGASVPAVHACGTLDGASHFAWHHNRTEINDTPIIIEFEREIEEVAIDPNDFLHTVLADLTPDQASEVIRSIYGNEGLAYAEKAWANERGINRIAIGDLMIWDPAVVAAHYENKLVIRARTKTLFRNVFSVSLPILPGQIIAVETPETPVPQPSVEVNLERLLGGF